MTDAAAAEPPSSGVPGLDMPRSISGGRAVLVGAGLVAALLADTLVTWLTALVGFFGALTAQSGLVLAASVLGAIALGVVPQLVGTRRVSRRLPVGRRPFLVVAALSSGGLVLAGWLDTTLVWAAHANDYYPDQGAFMTLAHVVVPAAWLASAIVWACSCLMSEARRRTGRAYRWPVVAAGLVMGAIQVASWCWLQAGLSAGVFSA
ncbi:hypothetical protein [Frondihabitans australicus]|uniref:Uncharacterized protein n=1 Tax=Frondihabitans australicus TaxID=386892 RepID=A0A495IC47_9MICO|nr:hypothetical protein [Frondihabitans australicus]RKR73220.1 hypothetical protein C8E83_0310 [Frondihabitans australicus]